MFDENSMKKAIGKKRWAKIQDYRFDCGVIDIAFKCPWLHEGYDETIFVYDVFSYGATKSEVINELKDWIDSLTQNENRWRELGYA